MSQQPIDPQAPAYRPAQHANTFFTGIFGAMGAGCGCLLLIAIIFIVIVAVAANSHPANT